MQTAWTFPPPKTKPWRLRYYVYGGWACAGSPEIAPFIQRCFSDEEGMVKALASSYDISDKKYIKGIVECISEASHEK